MARITIASLQATIVALETQLAEITRERASERPMSDYRRACEQARTMTMATGRSVKVGFAMLYLDGYITFSHDLNTWLWGFPGDWVPTTPAGVREMLDCEYFHFEILDI